MLVRVWFWAVNNSVLTSWNVCLFACAHHDVEFSIIYCFSSKRLWPVERVMNSNSRSIPEETEQMN